MSRVIKFRAWLDFEERMIKWNNLHLETDKTGLFIWVGDDEDDNFGSASGESGFKLMQFTGLTDKNGVEIYEGDIYENKNGVKWVIYYDTKSARFLGDALNRDYKRSSFSGKQGSIAGAVIGNIYEDKHLLEKGDENH